MPRVEEWEVVSARLGKRRGGYSPRAGTTLSFLKAPLGGPERESKGRIARLGDDVAQPPRRDPGRGAPGDLPLGALEDVGPRAL